MKKNSLIFVGLAIATVLAWVVYTSISQKNNPNLGANKVVSTPTPTQSTSLRGQESQLTTFGNQNTQENQIPAGEMTKGGIQQGNTQTPTPTVITAQDTKSFTTQVVRLKDNGFVPNTIVGKLGTTILFINDSSTFMQLSEDTSGTRILNGFAMYEGVGKNGTFEYILSKVGKTGFVNSKKTSQKGTLEIIQ